LFEKTYKDIELIGHWSMVLTGPDGAVKQTLDGKNVVVTNGKEFLASFLNSAATAASTFLMRYVAIGTDATAEAVSNTALGSESSRHTGTVTYTSGALYEVVATFAAGSGTGAIAEYGLLSANSSGTLFSRDTESVINKGASDTLTVTTKVTIG
tara:strand:- start:129 stop:590 length:462 start_codon:yes stop_codon:yes gene_type:complete